ncbi:MAG TPA: metalloregulator ArsR/SmtB family transcription factor [Paracoccaceae bacterium]|nr:metalloregulator ArsR/SmtB family transcription factor [Paracoccaceae bacterium]
MLNHPDPIDRLFQALADPSRRAILARLCDGPASVSELARPLAMSLPAVMQHLQVLEAGGLILSEKAGRIRTCRVRPEALAEAEHWIAARRAQLGHRLDRLGDFLAAEAGAAEAAGDQAPHNQEDPT